MYSFSDSNDFQALVKEWLPKIEAQLEKEFPLFPNSNDFVWEKAIRAAIFNGGKRTRPFLTILGWQIGTKKETAKETLLKLAIAVELIHCSSLIFDDLPCMDNATLRRGNRALHLEFGEDKAILIALALLLKGVELVIKVSEMIEPREQAQILLGSLMQSVGYTGLICGQWFDLSSKQSTTNEDKSNALLILRNLKTMPLIRFAILSGAILGQAKEQEKNVLTHFAEQVGDAYQQIDDLLDLVVDSNMIGKDTALDKKNDRLNGAYVNLTKVVYDVEEKLQQAHTTILNGFSDNTEAKSFLLDFTYYLKNRFQKALNHHNALVNDSK